MIVYEQQRQTVMYDGYFSGIQTLIRLIVTECTWQNQSKSSALVGLYMYMNLQSSFRFQETILPPLCHEKIRNASPVIKCALEMLMARFIITSILP